MPAQRIRLRILLIRRERTVTSVTYGRVKQVKKTRSNAVLPCLLILGACQLQADPEKVQRVVAADAELTRVATGFSFTEGPAADKDGNIFFTDQPNNRILKWSTDGTMSVFMDDAGRANGLYFTSSGNLVACADEDNQLWSISPEKEIDVLVADIDGKKLNGPNDLWVYSKGGIYFTDPYYERDYWTRSKPEIESENVYYLSPDGELTIVDDDLVKPNGVIGTEDGSKLYVADIGANKTYVYARREDGTVGRKQEFVPMGSDGMTIDTQGNLYLTGDGVTVFNASGEKIEHISIDGAWTANVTFGGKGRDILFITASDSVYTLEMAVQGAR